MLYYLGIFLKNSFKKKKKIRNKKVSVLGKTHHPPKVLTMAGSSPQDHSELEEFKQLEEFKLRPKAITSPFHQHTHSAPFSLMELLLPAKLLLILLLRAGIESNPGPTVWHCTICRDIIKRFQTSVKCNTCGEWCHLKCSGLTSHRQWNDRFIGSCCQPSAICPQTVNITNKTSSLSILQFNCNGLRYKIHEVIQFMFTNDIKIGAIQETRLNPNTSLNLPHGYHILRKDRTKDSGGGIAFILHDDVQYSTALLANPSPNDITIEQWE